MEQRGVGFQEQIRPMGHVQWFRFIARQSP